MLSACLPACPAHRQHKLKAVYVRALLSQGDNNYGDDRLLYARGQEWLHMHHIMGRAVG